MLPQFGSHCSAAENYSQDCVVRIFGQQPVPGEIGLFVIPTVYCCYDLADVQLALTTNQ
jgi:hypothetical protein